ncbi:MAG: Tn3 family transposase [Legionella sp.]|nr:Tn3 family transposase [Legionella sp.]
MMDWFGGKLCPRFSNSQAQVKHLYCGDAHALYNEWLIKPVGTINLQLIEEEWPNIELIIRALGLKEITQSILIKKLCTYCNSNRTKSIRRIPWVHSQNSVSTADSVREP